MVVLGSCAEKNKVRLGKENGKGGRLNMPLRKLIHVTLWECFPPGLIDSMPHIAMGATRFSSRSSWREKYVLDELFFSSDC